MPFSFIVIDGADGNTGRGVATYKGTAQIDNQTMDHFAHDRGQVRHLCFLAVLLFQ